MAKGPTEFDATDWTQTAVTANGSAGGGAIDATSTGTDPGGNSAATISVTASDGGVGILVGSGGQDRYGPGAAIVADCSDGVSLISSSETDTSVWALTRGPSSAAIFGINDSGSPDGVGVSGSTGQGTGVMGTSDSLNHAGIYGQNLNGVGVAGKSSAQNGAGVLGESDDGQGVIGTSNSDKSAGVYGECASGAGVSGSSQAIGVLGINTGTEGVGVFGETRNAAGTNGPLVGVRGVGGDIGVSGIGGIGVYGETAKAGGLAAAFSGNVQVNGGFVVAGGSKSAAVPHPDGSHRLLYCLESPESWFEDFGTGRLSKGSATVKLEKNFAAIVNTDSYHVFLSPEGESNGLYIVRKYSDHFDVKEQSNGTSSLRFSFRVVAKRKDILSRRLAKVKLITPQELRATSTRIPTIPAVKAGRIRPSSDPERLIKRKETKERKNGLPTKA